MQGMHDKNGIFHKNRSNDMAKTGRKPLYTDWLTPDGLLKIKGWIRDDNLTEKEVYEQKIGITRQTWTEWKKKFSDLNDTIKQARRPDDVEIMNSYYRDLKGHFVEEETTEITIHRDADNNIISKTEHKRKNKRWVQANPSERIFYLKVKKGWRENQDLNLNSEIEDDPLTKSLKEFAETLEKDGNNADK